MGVYQRPLRSDELYHAFNGLSGLRRRGVEWKNHKYIKKIDGRYFYTTDEIKAYLGEKTRQVRQGVNTATKNAKRAYVKNVVRGVNAINNAKDNASKTLNQAGKNVKRAYVKNVVKGVNAVNSARDNASNSINRTKKTINKGLNNIQKSASNTINSARKTVTNVPKNIKKKKYAKDLRFVNNAINGNIDKMSRSEQKKYAKRLSKNAMQIVSRGMNEMNQLQSSGSSKKKSNKSYTRNDGRSVGELRRDVQTKGTSALVRNEINQTKEDVRRKLNGEKSSKLRDFKREKEREATKKAVRNEMNQTANDVYNWALDYANGNSDINDIESWAENYVKQWKKRK